MNKKFSTKKKRIKLRLFFTFLMLLIGIYASYKNIEKKRIVLTDKELTNLIVDNSFTSNDSKFIANIIDKIADVTNPIKVLNSKYQTTSTFKEEKKVESPPIIYLYNSHQQEEYASSTLAEYSITPTVIMNNYILEDIFNKNNYKTIVEENSIKDILNKNNWKYYKSYNATRILLEENIIKYPTLKYFIDIHRDSLPKNRTTVKIDNKDYAKVLFLIGLENKNYEENLIFTEKINNKLNEYYKGLSKGILKKGGEGVNGVYNQDFNNRTILIEIGGYENTPTEVLNSAIAFSRCFMEVISEETN